MKYIKYENGHYSETKFDKVAGKLACSDRELARKVIDEGKTLGYENGNGFVYRKEDK